MFIMHVTYVVTITFTRLSLVHRSTDSCSCTIYIGILLKMLMGGECELVIICVVTFKRKAGGFYTTLMIKPVLYITLLEYKSMCCI